MPVRSLIGRLREWIELNREIHRLRHIDDHLLADMGLCRDEIRRRIRGR